MGDGGWGIGDGGLGIGDWAQSPIPIYSKKLLIKVIKIKNKNILLLNN